MKAEFLAMRFPPLGRPVEGLDGKRLRVEVPTRADEPSELIAAVYTRNWGVDLFIDGYEPRIIVALWNNGRILWSDDLIKGGPPYREASIELDRFEQFVEKLESDGVFTDPGLKDPTYRPIHYPTTIVLVRGKSYYLCLDSHHELYEQSHPHRVITSHPSIRVTGLTREEALAGDTEEWRRYRRVWAEVKAGLRGLASGAESKPSPETLRSSRKHEIIVAPRD